MKRLRLAQFLLASFAAIGLFAVIHTDHAAAAACAPTTNYGTVSQQQTIPATGTYRIWSRIKAADATNNAYMLQVDGTTCYTVGDSSSISSSAWTWVSYQNGTASSVISQTLTVGTHNFVMVGNEAGVQLDRIILTANLDCIPEGTGDNCANPPDTTAPIVSITSPVTNTSVSGTITVAATATDDVAMAKTELYVDGILKGTDAAAPYTYTLDTSLLAPGLHTITAKAYDTANNLTTSGVVSITVLDVAAPTVSLTAPAASATISGTVALTATALDNVGVVKVEFYVDGVLKGSDTTSPYSISLDTTALSNGSRSITAKAYDAAGLTATTTARVVTVQNTVTPPADITAPTVSVTSPAVAAAVGGTITMTATATDNVGVTKVEFYVDGTMKNADTIAPYSYAFDTKTITNASHSITAKAYDAAGNVTTSTAIAVTVNNVTIRPEDIDQDGVVGLRDFTLLAAKYGQSGAGLGRADIDGNGTVNLRDFTLLAQQYGK